MITNVILHASMMNRASLVYPLRNDLHTPIPCHEYNLYTPQIVKLLANCSECLRVDITLWVLVHGGHNKVPAE